MVYHDATWRHASHGSHHSNCIQSVCERLIDLFVIPSNLSLHSEGNYTPVRTAAFESLLLNPWFQKKALSRYLFAVVAHDPSRTVRRFVARALIDSLGILYTVGDVVYAPKDGEKSVLIEDDGSNSQKSKQLKKTQVELALKAIRKSAGKFGTVREVLMPTLLYVKPPHFDLLE